MPDLHEILAEEALTVEGLFYRLLLDEVRERELRAAHRRRDRADEERS